MGDVLALIIFLLCGLQGLTTGTNLTVLYEAAELRVTRNDYEAQALKLLKYWHQKTDRNEAPYRRGILCVTTMGWSEMERRNFENNAAHSTKFCRKWIAIIYDRFAEEKIMLEQIKNETLEWMMRHAFPPQSYIEFRIVPEKSTSLPVFKDICTTFMRTRFHQLFYSLKSSNDLMNPCEMSLDGPPLNIHFKEIYSKGSMFVILLNDLRFFEYIWTLDIDLKLDDFQFCKFWQIIQCAFPVPPLVSQPLITPTTQWYKFLNRQNWNVHMKERNRTYIASDVSTIEIQAPFINAKFFEWFIVSFLIPAVPVFQILGASWGIDHIFCSTAKKYMQMLLGVEILPNKPCAVIIDEIFLPHLNTKSLRKNAGEKFRMISHKTKKFLKRMFPSLSKMSFEERMAGPLSRKYKKNFQQIEKYHHELFSNPSSVPNSTDFNDTSQTFQDIQCSMKCLRELMNSATNKPTSA